MNRNVRCVAAAPIRNYIAVNTVVLYGHSIKDYDPEFSKTTKTPGRHTCPVKNRRLARIGLEGNRGSRRAGWRVPVQTIVPKPPAPCKSRRGHKGCLRPLIACLRMASVFHGELIVPLLLSEPVGRHVIGVARRDGGRRQGVSVRIRGGSA